MRKKCVHALDSMWKNLWDTATYTHHIAQNVVHVNKSTVLHSQYTAIIHSVFNTLHYCYIAGLSTSPTGPTITTLFLKNTLVNHEGGVV